MSQEFITEKVIAYIYETHNLVQLRELEADFVEKTDKLSTQFLDWLAYDFSGNQQKTSYGEIYLKNAGDQLEESTIKFIKNRINSYLGFYEVIKLKDLLIQLKNLFTNETHTINKSDVEEDIELHEILMVRLTQGDLSQIVSSNITVLPHQFKTLLVGQIIENYDAAKSRQPYLTFPQYFKENLLGVVGIVNRLLSFKNQEGDVTLYQSLYAVRDYSKTKEIFTASEEFVKDPDEEGLYQLMEADLQLAELILQRKKLEVECSNKEDQKTVKKILAEKLGESIVHVKDEELTIDDLI